jgi:soluble cytochrome b562
MMVSNRWARAIMFAAMTGLMIATPVFVSRSVAQEAPATQPAGQNRPRGGGRGPSLGSEMRSMGQAFEKINAQYKDPTKLDSTLTLLSTFETQALAAKSATPPMINQMPEADRKKAMDDYRQMMRNLVRTSLDLEDQLIAGDAEKATASIAKLADIEKTGHAAYRPPEN